MAKKAEAAAMVSAIEAQARRITTPCGDGSMVWRVWGTGKPVVLLHGGYGSWTHWIRTIPALSRHYELYIADMPGLGDSAMPPERTPESIADVVAAGMRELFGETQRPHLAGFSFGGMIAGMTAERLAQHGDTRLADLTLIGVAALGLPHRVGAPPFEKVRSTMNDAAIDAVHRHNLEILMFADAANIDAFAVYLQRENLKRARFKSRPYATGDLLARALPHVNAPLKTIWGSRDVIGRGNLDARLDVLREHHPELASRIIGGSGHWVMYEAADAFNAAFAELLDL